jgi:hypothetical protein
MVLHPSLNIMFKIFMFLHLLTVIAAAVDVALAYLLNLKYMQFKKKSNF